MADITLKQVRSSNNSSRKQLDTLSSLKLGKIGRESTMADTPQLRGMIKVVDHLILVDPDGADAGASKASGSGATGGSGS